MRSYRYQRYLLSFIITQLVAILDELTSRLALPKNYFNLSVCNKYINYNSTEKNNCHVAKVSISRLCAISMSCLESLEKAVRGTAVCIK